ncbi:MAG TPA: CBS domain-containing protein [Acidimicrobiales bacterium]|jgi:CBS domain-containing protein|nr:CBS domain-containing protein [Acidimicrobiales bacterium]
MKVRDVMNQSPPSITEGATMAEAAELLGRTHANDLAVLDHAGNFVGILAEGDLLRHALPKFEHVVATAGSVAEAFEMFLASGRDLAGQPVDRAVIRTPILLRPDDELLQAAAVMISKQIRTLVVVEDGRLMGTVSRADVALGVFGRST